MTRIRSLLALCVAALCLWPAPATAGGWWNSIDLDSSYVAIGDKFTFRQQIAFADSETARRARDINYGAYLMREINQELLDRAMSEPDPRRWWQPVPGMIRVGDVEILGSDSNLVRAIVRVSPPEIATGSYYLMLCDPGCREPLADVIPTRVSVTAEPLAAAALRQVERYRTHADIKILRLDRLARGSRSRVLALSHEVARLEAEVRTLRRPLPSTNERASDGWEPYVLGATAGMLLVLLGMLLVSGRRRRAGSAIDEIACDDIPDDARELVRTR